jgi:predicted AAA+ superfamily ATPase
MNDIRSPREHISEPLPRAARAALTAAMEVFPVVVVTGARQTGKSTLVRSHPALQNRTYLSLDDSELRDAARADPEALLARGAELVIDEVQRSPNLLSTIKLAVDSDRPRRVGRYILTGSANLLLMERVSESLAGRAYYMKLWPLTRAERRGFGRCGRWSDFLAVPAREWLDIALAADATSEDWQSLTAVGGLPVPSHELTSPEARALWFSGYVDTYLERDLQQLARIEDLGDFRRLVRATALRVGSVSSQVEIAKDAAISRPTAHRWLNLLETSFQILRLPAYAVNRGKRLVKSPKLYWSDVGLARHIAGGPATGAHLENLVLGDLVAWREVATPRPELFYWRTHNQEEVDFVIEAGNQLLPVEVKATTRPSYHDARHLIAFRTEYGTSVLGGLMLHCGSEVIWLAQGILAAPWWRVI